MTYNNFKEVHTFIFVSLLFINVHNIEMQGREKEVGQREERGGRLESARCKKDGRSYRLELRADERKERRGGGGG